MTDISSQGHRQAGEDEVELPITPPATNPPPFYLEYPEIPLHLSLDSLLAHSSSSGSSLATTMPPPKADQHSLDGSWTSLADDEYSTEDDLQSEHTDVGSLLDVHSSDDVHSVSEGVHASDAESADEEDLGDTLTEELDRGDMLGPSVRQESSIPRSSAYIPQTFHFKPDDIRETRTRSMSTHTTGRQLTEAEVQQLPRLRQNGVASTRYFSVIQMPVSDGSLDLDTHNHFKVLLLGRQVEQFRPEIQRKLGDVLVSQAATPGHTSPTSITRYHLVPNTFGPGAEPDFADLVAIDKQIDFDCYDHVTSSTDLGHWGQLTLKNRQIRSEIVSKWNGSRFVVGDPRWTAPDLAIICVHLDEENIMDSESHKMISFAERHGIPRILIRMDRGWHGYYTGALNDDSLHESVEPQHKQSHYRPSPKLPVDMAAFLNLEPALLNRHLAYAVSTAEQNQSREKEDLANLSNKSEEKPSTAFNILPRLNASLLKNAFIVLWIIGVYTFLGFHLWPILTDPASGAMSGKAIANGTTEQQTPITAAQLPFHVPSVAFFAPGKESQALQQVVDMASMSVVSAVADDTLHFHVGIASDSQLLVKLPKVALNRKKRSQLSVELRRKNQTIPVAVRELFEGVFSVQLLPHDAYGDIEVNLTMAKPRLNETLTVSFGERYNFELQHLRKLWSMLHGHLYEKASSISASLQDIRQRIVFDRFQTISRRAKEQLGRWRSSSPACEYLDHSTLSDLQLRFASNMQALHARFVRRKEDYITQGRTLAGVLSARYCDARLRLLDLVESTNPLRFRPRLDNAVIVENLETARGRAHRIMSNAAKNLRARNEGA